MHSSHDSDPLTRGLLKIARSLGAKGPIDESALSLWRISLDKLDARERTILELRNSLTGKPRMTLAEIGERFRLTRERIRQLEERALIRLERESRKSNLL